jgi:hypothetical protein
LIGYHTENLGKGGMFFEFRQNFAKIKTLQKRKFFGKNNKILQNLLKIFTKAEKVVETSKSALFA